MTYEDALEQIRFCDSYARLSAILNLSDMNRADWLRVLGENWTTCDNIAQSRDDLERRLGTVGPVVDMMTKEELTKLDALPAIVPIFRGCGEHNINGASWSLNKDTAASFPFLHRYRVEKPILISATVERARIVALKIDRGEQEVITFSAKILRQDTLSGLPH